MRKDLIDIKCSVQRALIGYITSNLRSVCVNIDENEKITLIFYYNEEPSEDERELASLTDTEFISDFSLPEFDTDAKVLVLPYPKPIPKSTAMIYKKYEGNVSVSLTEKFINFFSKKDKQNQVNLEDETVYQGKLICTIQDALLGKITENLRSISEDNADDTVFFTFYYDKEPSEKEKELFLLTEQQFKNAFKIKVQFKICSFSYPKRIPLPNKRVIYERYEDRSQLV